jgi:hypothetical protein
MGIVILDELIIEDSSQMLCGKNVPVCGGNVFPPPPPPPVFPEDEESVFIVTAT